MEKQFKLTFSPVYTDELRSLKAQVDMLRAQNFKWKASSEARHAKGSEKTKSPPPPKEMDAYLKKHKPKK